MAMQGLSSRASSHPLSKALGSAYLMWLACLLVLVAAVQGTYSRVTRRPVTFLSNLLLASLAGVCNVLVTLPMDVVVTRWAERGSGGINRLPCHVAG